MATAMHAPKLQPLPSLTRELFAAINKHNICDFIRTLQSTNVFCVLVSVAFSVCIALQMASVMLSRYPRRKLVFPRVSCFEE
jgi:hypothetical protein